MTDPLTFAELAELIGRVPKPPKLEFHCHPGVSEALKRGFPPESPHAWRPSNIPLNSMPIIEHEEYPAGYWRLVKDDATIDWGFYL